MSTILPKTTLAPVRGRAISLEDQLTAQGSVSKPAFFKTQLGSLYHENCLTWMRQQANASIDTCCTSPPYYQLRNYGEADQMGQERSPAEYLEMQESVFSEVYRLLKPTGSLWLNIADTYYGGAPDRQPKDAAGLVRRLTVERLCERCGAPFTGKPSRRFCSSACGGSVNRKRTGFERPKCMLGLPWRLATRLVDLGFILRNAIIWHKPNAMPCPQRDRLPASYEWLFHLVKDGQYDAQGKYSSRYHYDCERIPHSGDVWTIPTQSGESNHHAAFPLSLIEPPILASTPRDGLVFDPFMGTGTVALAAERNDLRWSGTELSETYCSATKQRLRQGFIPGLNA